MPPALSDDLVRHVLRFVADRRVRCAIGYDVDACIKWRIPPPPLHENPEFEGHLDRVRRGWLSGNGVRTVAGDVMNQATFMHWGDYDHEHAGFTMHSVCYRSDFNPKVWRVDRVLQYYRYNAEGVPACVTTQCERRERAAVNG
jgi:hypothetical protein